MDAPGERSTQAQLAERLAALGVNEEDLEEVFVRSAGRGGQNLNKTATCVMLWHRPSGVRVKCQVSRHQGVNRRMARQILAEKLETLRKEKAGALRAAAARKRRQNRARSQGAKERILRDKARRGSKKALRRRVAAEQQE